MDASDVSIKTSKGGSKVSLLTSMSLRRETRERRLGKRTDKSCTLAEVTLNCGSELDSSSVSLDTSVARA